MATETRLPIVTKPSQQKIDTGKALKLRLQGLSCEEIGKIFSVSRSAVDQALQKFKPFLESLNGSSLQAYSDERASLFNVVEQHLTGSLLDPDALAKASLNNRAYALKVIHEARRLESNQSTSNISVLGKFIQQAESALGRPAVFKQTAQAAGQAEPEKTE